MQQRRTIAAIIAAVAVGGTSIVAATSQAGEQPAAQQGTKPLSAARILFELNATARDAGVQALVDAEGWRSMKLYDPNGKQLLRVRADGSVGKVGVTELFFESAEPSLDDLPLKELLEMYPEGDYTLVGKSVEGDTLVGVAPLTHDIPGNAKVLSPKRGTTTDPKATVVRWQPVTKPKGITIDHYQIIVETDEDPLRIFSVEVDDKVSRVTVPSTFLQRKTDYKLEVIAVEEGLNQTITESTFRTR